MTLILKTFDDIQTSIWNSEPSVDNSLSLTEDVWSYDRYPIIQDVYLWEQLYYVPGTIGIYAAFSPHIEYYLIVYNLYQNLPQGIEHFYGSAAAKKLYDRSISLGIQLFTATIWVDNKEIWLYDSID